MTMTAGPDDTIKKAGKRKPKQPVKFKKAPQAPRRFKSAYMFFSTSKHPEIRARLKEEGIMSEKTTKIAKMVSQEWKDLSPKEREKWDEMAREDKARFEMEKTMYTGPWKVPAKKRSQKDPDAPKRPMSAFLSFSNSKRAETRRTNPHCSNAEISRILAQLWKEAAEEERKEHIDKEYKLRQAYKIAIAEWKKKAEIEMQAERQIREDVARKAAANRDSAQALGPGGSGPPYEDGANPSYYQNGSQGDYYAQGTAANMPYGQQEDPSSFQSYGNAAANYAAYSSAYGSGGYPAQYAAGAYGGGGYEGAAGAAASYYGNASYGQSYPYYSQQQYGAYAGYEGGAQRESEQAAAMAEAGGHAASAAYGEYGA